MSEPVIQSYVLNKWFVSTIYRETSAVNAQGLMYYETIVWPWDSKTGKREHKIIFKTESRIDAARHFSTCKILLTEGEVGLEERES